MQTFHFTDKDSWNTIRSQVDWCFTAQQPPPSRHPPGAYFTTLDPATPNLAKKLRISKAKVEYAFGFAGLEHLKPLLGGRGEYIYYSPGEYTVDRSRQRFNGLSVTYRRGET